MKNIRTILGAIIIVALVIVSCGQNNSSNKQKELELKERELALKEKEFALKQNDTVGLKPSSNTTEVKPTSANEITLSNGYNFDKHNDIKIFINDLAKAVSTDDKNSIAQMINFPFVDEWGDNSYNQSPPLGCKTANQFFEKYDKIFLTNLKNAIISKKYRAADNSDEMFSDVIENGEYLIEPKTKYVGKRPDNMLGIKKVNGKFKIYAIKFYS